MGISRGYPRTPFKQFGLQLVVCNIQTHKFCRHRSICFSVTPTHTTTRSTFTDGTSLSGLCIVVGDVAVALGTVGAAALGSLWAGEAAVSDARGHQERILGHSRAWSDPEPGTSHAYHDAELHGRSGSGSFSFAVHSGVRLVAFLCNHWFCDHRGISPSSVFYHNDCLSSRLARSKTMENIRCTEQLFRRHQAQSTLRPLGLFILTACFFQVSSMCGIGTRVLFKRQDFLGGWSAEATDMYSTVARLRTCNIQLAVAKALIDWRIEDPLPRSWKSIWSPYLLDKRTSLVFYRFFCPRVAFTQIQKMRSKIFKKVPDTVEECVS